MGELQVPELIACLFLFLFLIRPLIKRLWPMEGLTWFPLIALGIIIGLFPAYGFRPELVPLLILALIINFANIPSLMALLTHLRNDDYRERNSLLTILSIILLIGTAGIALYFLPSPEMVSRGVRTVTLRDESRGVELIARVYGPEATGGIWSDSGTSGGAAIRPLMLLVPPVTGSVGVVDTLCGKLRDLGFTVITYSRRDFDFPALGENGRRIAPPWGQIVRLLRAISRGAGSVAANAQGRRLEEARRQDTAFLLARIGQKTPSGDSLPADLLAGTSRENIFLAGYGMGGAGLLLLAGEGNFRARFPGVRGIIAVESPVLSILRGEERETPPVSRKDIGWFRAIRSGLSNWAQGLKPQRITAMASPASPAVPLLLLVSDRAFQDQRGGRRYTTVWRFFEAAQNPAIIAAVPGAGPLDYSDIPEKYPLYSAIFPGKAAAPWQKTQGARTIAALMTNFAALLLEGIEGAGEDPATNLGEMAHTLQRTRPEQAVQIETRGIRNTSIMGDAFL
jgi:hypothetical protein